MAHLTTTRPAPFGAISAFRVVNTVETVVRQAVAWNQKRQTKSVLLKLSDHELADIGMERHEIESL